MPNFKKSFTAIILICLFGLKSSAQSIHANLWQLWDDKPASDWMKQAYPIGNGRIGGMVFGGTTREHIQFNDNTLWTGGENDRGMYQAFGDLFIDFDNNQAVNNYRRSLDISDAVQQISYQQGNVQFNREYFASFPDKVMVFRYTANKKSAYTATISIKDAHQGTVVASGNQLSLNGVLSNGMKYQASVRVIADKSTVVAGKNEQGQATLKVDKADALTLIFTGATDFLNQRDKNWKGEDPAVKIKHVYEAVDGKSYKTLLTRHIKDYQQLFGRLKINLGNSTAEQLAMPTVKRLVNYKKQVDHALEALIFQYGRYLLISSSRPGGLPANLQGLWNNTNTPPWGSDYHSNINIQMNYWLAEPTNLSECQIPYLDYINSIREVAKEATRKEFPGTRGWTVRTENNSFGGMSYLWNTPGSAWYAQALWDHFSFTRDTAYLKNFAYPILKEIVQFWDDHLKRRPDATVVAPMGWSPEHGPREDGVTHDQQIVYDLFTNYVETEDVLAIDPAYQKHIADLKAHLLKPKIGKWGQLQEWETDRDDPKDTHRHVSHLFGLHPGREISVTGTPELAQAAKVSLTARGDASTGWSMAWKINFWARLQDGNHAYKILRNFISLVGGAGTDYNKGGGIYANLFCAHPPFQIDGNLGYPAGVTEMLLQSQTGEIILLPALPDEWANGDIQGLKARGNFEIVNLVWENGKVKELVIKSLSGTDCKLSSVTPLRGSVKGIVDTKSGANYRYSFKTKKGGVYKFTAINR